MRQPVDSTSLATASGHNSLPAPTSTSSSSGLLDKLDDNGRSTSGGMSGGLSSLSTLSGLLNTASTFKPRKEEGQSNQRNGKGESLMGGRTRQGQFEGGRFDEFAKGFGGGVLGGRFGGWKDDRDNSRMRSDGLQKSFGFRTHNSIGAHESEGTHLRLSAASDSGHIYRSSASTPGTSTVSPQTEPSPSAPLPKTPESMQGTEDRGLASTPGLLGAPANTQRLESSEHTQADSEAAAVAIMATARSAETQLESRRPRRQLDPSEQLRREVYGLLNKLTIENFPTVAEKLAKICEEVKIKELETVIEHVLDKAFAEPDFSELYADLCLVLSYRCLQSSDSVSLGKQSLFSALLIQKWREAFDKMPTTVEFSEEQKATLSAEEQEILITKMKTRVRGMCLSLAEFVIRRMVGMGGFSRAASVLLTKEAPEEHYIEGICQMLLTAGAFLDNDPAGNSLVETCLGRLQELQAKGLCSKRITCLIQDLIDARKVGWHKKIHKEKAKGLSALKEEVENADLVGGSVIIAQFGTVVKLGQRSNLENMSYAKYLNEQEERFKQLKH